MEAFFYVIPSIIIIGVLFAAAKVIGRSRQVSRAWSSGLAAEARCLRTYTTTSGGGGDSSVHTSLHHVYEFTTREGRVVRFEESGGPGTTLEGDIVLVRYAADHPERATAKPPAHGRLAADAGCFLVFFGVVITFCIGFMVTAHAAFSVADDFFP